jgi:hypothetical protein
MATATITATPQAVIWAPGTVDVGTDIQDAMGALLFADPPPGWQTNIYAATDATNAAGDWAISLINLAGVDPPYTDWNFERNAAWAGSVTCSEVVSVWTCEYYDPPPLTIGGGEYGLAFPWRPGTRANYGTGYHGTCEATLSGVGGGIHCGTVHIPGSLAVDFLGGDNYGSNIMPAEAYAAESGTVTFVCRSTSNIGVRVEGNYKLYYLHLSPTTSIANGDVVTAGHVIGPLVYGTFSDDCGWGSQTSSTYHLHFAFERPASGYLEIGGCVLALSSGIFSCNGSSIGVNGYLTNTGAVSPPAGPTITPGGPTVTPGSGEPTNPVAGGEHIWDGIVSGIVSLITSVGQGLLPQHTTIGLADTVDRVYTSISDFAWLIAASQIIYIVPTVAVWGIILTLEVIRFIFIAYRWIVRILPLP